MKSEEKNGPVDRTPWDDESGLPLLLSSVIAPFFLTFASCLSLADSLATLFCLVALPSPPWLHPACTVRDANVPMSRNREPQVFLQGATTSFAKPRLGRSSKRASNKVEILSTTRGYWQRQDVGNSWKKNSVS